VRSLERNASEGSKKGSYQQGKLIQSHMRSPSMVYTKSYYVYLLTNWNNRVIYVGVTNDLPRRMYEHKNKLIEGFTQKYNINKLVYFEETNDINVAIAREKEIKKWRREKKDRLIEQMNPNWKDLGEML
jgi:putative endonuclease